MDDEQVKIIEALVPTIERPINEPLGAEYVTKSGVVLLFKKVPPFLPTDAIKKLKEPEVPEYYNEEKEATEPNPADPSYIIELELYNARRGELVTNIYLNFGITVKTVPPSLIAPDDDAWIEAIEATTGLVIPRKGDLRKTAWLKYVALDDQIEVQLVSLASMAFNGVVTEQQVYDIMNSFRSDEKSTLDTGVSDPPADSDEHSLRESPRDSIGVRTEGDSTIYATPLALVQPANSTGTSSSSGPL